MAGLDQGVADLLADRLAYRDRELMLERAVMDDLDQLLVAQHFAVLENDMGDGDFVIGEGEHEIARRVGLFRQFLG